MKLLIVFLITLCPFAFAQPASVPISRQIRSFSPMAQIYLTYLGLEDRNGNGVIDRSEGEGYEGFIEKYGNADVGFYLNGITQGAQNGRLEENEILNHYYLNIRFKPEFETETAAIEYAVKSYVHANKLPLVWLDDRQSTVMRAVSLILGIGWQDKKVSESAAVEMWKQVTYSMDFEGLPSDPDKTGYCLLPEFINRKRGYCFEIAEFGFWFFSQLKINALVVTTALSPGLIHAVIMLPDSNTMGNDF